MPATENKRLSRDLDTEYSTDDGANWTRLPNLTSARVPKEKPQYVEVTDLDSTGREWLADFPNVDEIELTGHYRDTTYNALHDDLHNKTVQMRTALASGRSVTYGALTSVSIEGGEGNTPLMYVVSVRPTGGLTFSAAE